MNEVGCFTCSKCGIVHTSNLTAPRVYDKFLVLSGRGGGKTLIGAHACREEMMIPNSIGWVMGPTYKILHDSTFPTLIRLISPSWVKDWDQEHMELHLKNGALVAFRSLEDPERARGPHGVSWGWLDESAQCPERAYDVFEPTLIRAAGIIICTTTVMGYDWTFEKIEKRAANGEPGYWACKYWTEENPLFRSNPVMMAKIERARATMSPDFYNQEYRAERANAQGLIYSGLVDGQVLPTDEAIRRLIPEWPALSPSRQILIGLDSGTDHPFGASMIAVTEEGLVVVGEYLRRMQAFSQQLPAILMHFGLKLQAPITWAANKNEANLRLEFGLLGASIVPVESRQEVGIQRVQSWLHTKRLYFAYTCPKTIEQMKAYRWAENTNTDGQKRDKERVFKLNDELPDGLRYALMSWPFLPEPVTALRTPREQQRWDAFDDKTRADIERMRTFTKQDDARTLTEGDAGYPLGNFWGNSEWSAW